MNINEVSILIVSSIEMYTYMSGMEGLWQEKIV